MTSENAQPAVPKADAPLKWYCAYVLPQHERKAAEALQKMGIDHFLPIQKVKRQWSDRVKVIDKVLLPRMIFVHATEKDRILAVNTIDCMKSYMGLQRGVPVVIPDNQMKDFIFMVTHSDHEVEVSSERFAPGDHVKVTRGQLEGLECELLSVKGRKCVAVRLGPLGTMMIEMPLSALTKIEDKTQ